MAREVEELEVNLQKLKERKAGAATHLATRLKAVQAYLGYLAEASEDSDMPGELIAAAAATLNDPAARPAALADVKDKIEAAEPALQRQRKELDALAPHLDDLPKKYQADLRDLVTNFPALVEELSSTKESLAKRESALAQFEEDAKVSEAKIAEAEVLLSAASAKPTPEAPAEEEKKRGKRKKGKKEAAPAPSPSTSPDPQHLSAALDQVKEAAAQLTQLDPAVARLSERAGELLPSKWPQEAAESIAARHQDAKKKTQELHNALKKREAEAELLQSLGELMEGVDLRLSDAEGIAREIADAVRVADASEDDLKGQLAKLRGPEWQSGLQGLDEMVGKAEGQLVGLDANAALGKAVQDSRARLSALVATHEATEAEAKQKIGLLATQRESDEARVAEIEEAFTDFDGDLYHVEVSLAEKKGQVTFIYSFF